MARHIFCLWTTAIVFDEEVKSRVLLSRQSIRNAHNKNVSCALIQTSEHTHTRVSLPAALIVFLSFCFLFARVAFFCVLCVCIWVVENWSMCRGAEQGSASCHVV